jgi:hypothetical protein
MDRRLSNLLNTKWRYLSAELRIFADRQGKYSGIMAEIDRNPFIGIVIGIFKGLGQFL